MENKQDKKAEVITKAELMYLLKPVLILLSLLILLFLTISIGYNQVKNIISKTEASKKVETTLNEKISILENVTRVISGDTTFLDVVVPSKAATLYGLSQIKNQGQINGVIISNVKTGTLTPDKNGLSKAPISFDAEGSEESLYTFLQSFTRVLPLMNIESVKISNTGSIAKATVALTVFSAELPKTIPSVTSVTNDLTPEELSQLKDLATYTLPIFIEPKPIEVSPKEDPFN